MHPGSITPFVSAIPFRHIEFNCWLEPHSLLLLKPAYFPSSFKQTYGSWWYTSGDLHAQGKRGGRR